MKENKDDNTMENMTEFTSDLLFVTFQMDGG